MKNIEIDQQLSLFTDYLNLTIKIDSQINSYENLGITTPEEIQSIINDLHISSNLLIIFADCLTIAKSFNYSKIFLYQTFYAKSIYRIIYETFKLLDKYSKSLFKNSDENDFVNKIIKKQRKFRKDYNIERIRLIRNNISSHYTENFIEHINFIKEINLEDTLNMFYVFLDLISQISTYITVIRFPLDKSNEMFQAYFRDVEKKLIDINKNN